MEVLCDSTLHCINSHISAWQSGNHIHRFITTMVLSEIAPPPPPSLLLISEQPFSGFCCFLFTNNIRTEMNPGTQVYLATVCAEFNQNQARSAATPSELFPLPIFLLISLPFAAPYWHEFYMSCINFRWPFVPFILYCTVSEPLLHLHFHIFYCQVR